jgi:endo-1,3(4)-beta-glucanase
MLAVQARALSNYFLMQSTNQVQPAQFIPNMVSGILFENKVDRK